MIEKDYILRCPICNKTYGVKLDEETLNSYLLIGKHIEAGLKCSGCGSRIVYNSTNLSLNP